MAKQFCENLISGLEKGLRNEFTQEEMVAFADYDQRVKVAPSVLEKLRKSPDWSAQLGRLSEDPKGQLSAVREVLHLMADRAAKRATKVAVELADRQEELVA